MRILKNAVLLYILMTIPAFLYALNSDRNISEELVENEIKMIWSIGEKDGSANEFALAPDGFEDFKYQDFGFEDKFFVVGFHNEKEAIPYVLPGPVDTWGGTWSTSGWRSNQITILF